jgi:hypothetical protein
VSSNADFAAVSAVCSLLSDLTVPYWIIGGWAIDLAVGRVTRDHADVDVMLLERDKHALWNDLPADVQIAWSGRRLTVHGSCAPPISRHHTPSDQGRGKTLRDH